MSADKSLTETCAALQEKLATLARDIGGVASLVRERGYGTERDKPAMLARLDGWQTSVLESVALLAAVEGAQQADRLNDLCQSEGPRGETICMLALGHEGPCGWERL